MALEKGSNILTGPGFKFAIPECSLGDILISKLKSQPEDNVIEVNAETGEIRTSQQLLTATLKVAEGLRRIGLQLHDVVALLSENRKELYAAALGAVCMGGTAAPLDPSLKVLELKHLFGLIKPKFVFCERPALSTAVSALELLKINAKIIIFDSNNDAIDSYITFKKLCEVDENVDIQSVVKSPSTTLAFIMPSSGTTGMPKAVGLTHRNLIVQLLTFEENPKLFEMKSCLQISHFFWISGVLTLLLSTASGVKRIFVRDATDENVLKAIHEYKPTWGIVPPSVIASLLNHPNFKEYDVTSMKTITTGGSPVPSFLFQKIKDEWSSNSVLIQAYGMTELSGIVTSPTVDTDVTSVGKPAVGISLKIVDLNTGKPLGANKIGEICLKSEGVMKCYVGNEEATKETIEDDGWYHSGDLGYYDNNNNIFIMDRIKEMIKVRNMQIAPAELETLIESMPGVLEAGVAGIPNNKDMYHPMAIVVKKNGANVTEDDITSYVRDNLSEYKHLKGGVRFVDSLPRTPTGKIKRSKLKELAMSLYQKRE